MIISKQKASPKTQIIFNLWNEVLEQRGSPTPDTDDIFEFTYEFKIDRENDQKSLLKVDEISVDRLTHIIDEFFGEDKGLSNLFKSEDREKWLLIIINPSDPYTPDFARLSRQLRVVKDRQVLKETELRTEYLVKCLTVGISSLGKGFEFTKWETARQLKEIPKDNESIQNLRSSDVADRTDQVQNLTRSTLRRIQSLAKLARRGNVIES
ncbi:MAG TPA: hypothetical protein VIK81_03630 [Patescibacteria group bacterium]